GGGRGRAAEYWGEEGLASDKTVWTHDVPGITAMHWEAQSPESKAILEAFAAGMNAYAEAHPESLDPRLLVVLPIIPQDVLGHAVLAIQLLFTGRVNSVEN